MFCSQALTEREAPGNRLILGDCVKVLRKQEAETVDLTVTDPPYLVNYRSRDGRSIQGDSTGEWLDPAFAEIFRVMKWNSLCISFYGWNRIDDFMKAWKSAGFIPVGHLVWHKPYASRSRFLAYTHEQAYLLAKGRPELPASPLPDVQPWVYSGNKLHPTQKCTRIIEPLIKTFSQPGDLVLDPFAGSGTTGEAARNLGRRSILIEKDAKYYQLAKGRLTAEQQMGLVS